jgi:hypothetical protein
MTLTGFQQVLTAARRLPKRSQVKLASTLLSEAQAAPPLETLNGLNEAELRALADAVLAPANARRLKHLLQLNRDQALTPAQQTELTALLEESDQMALVKARARYTLHKRPA